jgi:hypothetical protein
MLAASSGDGGLVCVVFALFAAFAIGSFVWTFSRSGSMLQRWAEENGYTLISSEYRWLARGPYWWRTNKGQTVYRIEVRDANGNHRSGWARCGGWFFGLLSDVVDVKWDDQR